MKNTNKKSPSISGICFVLLIVLFGASEVRAGYTWQVDKNFVSGLCNDVNRACTSLKAAVAGAVSGDKITISGGRYDGEYDILIENKNLEIVGAGQPQMVSLGVGMGTDVDYTNGTAIYAYNSLLCPTCSTYTHLGRVFKVKNSIVTVSNMWIAGASSGDGGAVLIESGGKATFRNVKITGDTGSGASGGAIYNNGGTLNLYNAYITGHTGSFNRTDNRVGGSGGGLYNKGGKVMIADSHFRDCFIWRAGNGNMPGTTPNRRGFSAGNGGAIYNDAAGEIIIVRSDLINNEAGEGGFGGEGSGFTIGAGYDGATGGSGGAIHNEGSVYISDSSIAFNASGPGGSGGYSSSDPGDGAGGGFGGGIFNNGSLNIVNSTVSGNRASGGGKGGGAGDGVSGGKGGAGGWGGGIYNAKTLEMTNVTVTGNTSGGGGGGGLGGLLASNGAAGSGGDGGGVVNGTTVVTNFINLQFTTTIIEGNSSAKNTIVAGNTGGNHPDVAGKFYSNGYNLIGVPYDDSNFRADGDQKGTSAAPLNPKLGAAAYNGGRGSGVSHDLLAGSPAIDAGDDSVMGIPFELAYDQRGAGFTRKYGSRVDIGAIETFPPNTAPTASAQTVSANEDIAKTITLSASDAENDSLTYTITNPSNGTLSGTAPNLTYTPKANFNGSDSFTFKVNDGDLDSNVAKVTITVAAVNDVPTFTKGIDPTVLEDAGAQTVSGFISNISAGPADESGQTVSLSVSSNTNSALFSAQPTIDSTGKLTFTPAADANGSATVSFAAKDTGGTANGGADTTAQTFEIKITLVNDAPSFTRGANQTVNEDAGAQSIANWATAISKGPANESAQTIVFEATNNNNGLFSAQPTVSSAGVLTYTPAANASGTATVTLRIKDDGGTAGGGVDASAAQSFTLTVNAVNDAPLAANDRATQNLQYSDAVQTVNIGGTDIDSPSLTASASFTKDGGSSQTGLPSGLALSSPANCTASTVQLVGAGTSCGWTISGRATVAPGTYVVTVTINDGALRNSTGLTITVNKETTQTDYAGDNYVTTAGPNVGTASSVRLAARLTQETDGAPGDITLAKARIELYKFSNTTATPNYVFGNLPVNSNGDVETTVSLAVDDAYTVRVVIESGNAFWTANPIYEGTLTVAYGSIERRVTGGGWVADAGSANGKGNFGFTVNTQNNGSPKGNALYTFRGADSYNYRVKSNSWQGGGLTFYQDAAKAAFSGKCNVQKIDPATGATIESWGNYTFTVDIVDGDLKNPRESDRYAIQILTDTGALWRQIGSRTDPMQLGGGNVAVRSK